MLESGDRTVGVGEGGLKVREDLGRRSMLAWQLWRRTPCGQCGADFALAQVEPFPDALPGPITSAAVGNDADRSGDAGDGALEESPQSAGCQTQPPDFVGEPDAKGSPATATSIAVTAKDPPSAHGSSLGTALVESAQKAVPNEGADRFAMRTGRLLEPLRNCAPFVVATAKPTFFAHDRSMLRENR